MKLALLANIDAVLAQRALESGDTSGLSGEEFRLLALAATGSKAVAAELLRKRMAAQLKAGVPVT